MKKSIQSLLSYPLIFTFFSLILACGRSNEVVSPPLKEPSQSRIPNTSEVSAVKTSPKVEAGGYRISGPYTHANLSIFLIHGEDRLEGGNFLTLEEALAQKKLIVYETGDVNELAVQNLSKDENVFIQAGEIVKGGKQDRVISTDFIVPAKSKKMAISSFCVEQGRWNERNGESVSAFESANDQVSSKKLKIAVRASKLLEGEASESVQTSKGQGEVWKEVKNTQEKLEGNLGKGVKDKASTSSLQLTLESQKVKEGTEKYIKALLGIIEDKPDTIGYAFAINDEINSADIYASSQFFRKLWPKLLKASSVEALGESITKKPKTLLTVADIVTYLAEAETGRSSEEDVNEHISTITNENEKTYKFETKAKKGKGVSIRTNYLSK